MNVNFGLTSEDIDQEQAEVEDIKNPGDKS